MSGVAIDLMGIDGVGKSTLARAIRRELTAAGVEVVELNWSALVTKGGLPQGFPRDTFEQLGVEGWRLMYGGEEPADGAEPFYDAVPRLFATEGAAGLMRGLPVAPTGVHQSSVVTSALVEFAGTYLARAEVVAPALARGAVTVSDAFGLRNIHKVLTLAQHMTPAPVPADTLDRLSALLRDAYGDPFMQPDIGLHLDGDPALAYTWRLAQSGRIGPGEDLTLAGRGGRDGYVEFQSTVAAALRDAAVAWGWHTLTVDGRPAEQTAAEALRIVREHKGIRRLIDG